MPSYNLKYKTMTEGHYGMATDRKEDLWNPKGVMIVDKVFICGQRLFPPSYGSKKS